MPLTIVLFSEQVNRIAVKRDINASILLINTIFPILHDNCERSFEQFIFTTNKKQDDCKSVTIVANSYILHTTVDEGAT